nr:hypothetical protein [uncultured Cellulosilyticum sp.]
MKYIVCFSGGHSSALVAVEAVRRAGKNNVILLNHNISPEVEHEDIKRFKQEVADYLEIPITYANMDGWEHLTPLRICKQLGGFKFGNSPVLCTYNLKTKPFYKWLHENYPTTPGYPRKDIRILYGFDKNEQNRINRRVGIMFKEGYCTDYPLAYWKRTIQNIEEIGIKRPCTYERFRHANCIGCLKAGKQQWYIVYCLYPEIWQEAKDTEAYLGYSILKDTFLEELEPQFAKMRCRGIVPGEGISAQKFWADVRKELSNDDERPCECSF